MKILGSYRLLLIVLVAILATASAKEFSHSSGLGTTREEIIANREKRKKQIQEMLDQAKETMDDHKSGRRLLDDKEFTGLEKKISAYERKLETMSGEMDDREVDRVLQREKLRYERDAQRREERRQRASEF